MARLLQFYAVAVMLVTQVLAVNVYYLQIIDHTGAQILTNPSHAQRAPRQAVQISNFNFGVTTPVDVATGRPEGRSQVTSFTVNRTADVNSPLILSQEINNALLRTVTLSADSLDAEGVLVTNFKYALTNAQLVSFSQGPASASGVIETLSFTFQKLVYTDGPNAVTVDFGGPVGS